MKYAVVVLAVLGAFVAGYFTGTESTLSANEQGSRQDMTAGSAGSATTAKASSERPLGTASGSMLPENNNVKKVLIYPKKSKAMNLAFDVTPAKYVTGLITEKGVCEASEEGLKSFLQN